MGQVSGPGTLVVETARPHELWLDSEMLSQEGSGESHIQLNPSASTSQRLTVRTSLRQGDWLSGESNIRILLDGREIAQEASRQPDVVVKPLADIIHGDGAEGFTWFFTPIRPLYPPPEGTVTALRNLGFGSIIVPFYGNLILFVKGYA